MNRILPAALVFVCLLLPETGEASKPKNQANDWHLSLEGKTDVPLHIGTQVVLEMPFGIRLSTALGVLPSFYLNMVNSVMVSTGVYNSATGQLLKNTLSSGLVWRIHLGWRPVRSSGFYFEVGYGLITLRGRPGTKEVIKSAVTELPDRFLQTLGESWEIDSTLHMLDLELGWRWLVWKDRLVIRLSLGFAGTFSAFSSAKPAGFIQQSNPEIFGGIIERALNKIYQSYIFTPTVGFGVGYRFF